MKHQLDADLVVQKQHILSPFLHVWKECGKKKENKIKYLI